MQPRSASEPPSLPLPAPCTRFQVQYSRFTNRCIAAGVLAAFGLHYQLWPRFAIVPIEKRTKSEGNTRRSTRAIKSAGGFAQIRLLRSCNPNPYPKINCDVFFCSIATKTRELPARSNSIGYECLRVIFCSVPTSAAMLDSECCDIRVATTSSR